MAKLTKEERDNLAPEGFAVPGKRELPIHDEHHTRLAWSMVDRTEGLTSSERAVARRNIKRRAKELGIARRRDHWHLERQRRPAVRDVRCEDRQHRFDRGDTDQLRHVVERQLN